MSLGKNEMPVIIPNSVLNNFGTRVAFTANPNMCWEWRGVKNKFGYGYLSIVYGDKRKKIKVHRLSYYIHYKVDPKGFLVMHTCDNPSCCNPKHLKLGDDKDNSDDKIIKGRGQRGETNAHAKRTENDILEIRKLFKEGMSRHEIANKFNMPYNSVVSIILRRDWKHI